MLIDFKEIPESNGSGNTQDIFEKFCRDFLQEIGYRIISDPARGADGGIDILVEEIRTGPGGTTIVRWLVSCKHYAHSGKSITKSTEQDIRDRVECHDCHGFIGFYTTIAGRSLLDQLESLSNKLQFQTFDNEKIEQHIIGNKKTEYLLIRYFPQSYKKWKELYSYQEPVKLLNAYIKNTEANFNTENNHRLSNTIKFFGTTIAAIKRIRTSNSLIEALMSENISFHVAPEFSQDNKIWNKSFVEVESIIKSALVSLGLDPDLSEHYKEWSMQCIGSAKVMSYVLFSNRVLVCPEYVDDLQIAFNEIKELLN